MRFFAVVAIGVLSGCYTVPREVETVLHLGPDKVEIDVQLRDIRTTAPDELNQLQLFSTVSAWKADWVDTKPWAPTPDVYRFTADAGRLDLIMHGTMKRSEFDACARADAGVCEGFPLALSASGYSAAPVIEVLKLTLPSSVKTAWPANATTIAFTVAVTPQMESGAAGPSFVRGFELFASDPAAATKAIAQMNEAEKQFTEAPVPVWAKTASELTACGDSRWCQLRVESLRRSQAILLYRYLLRGKETAIGLREPPEQQDAMRFDFGSMRSVLPKDSFAPIDELRLRVAYDNGLNAYRANGALGWSAATFRPVCRGEGAKKKSLKELCMRLGAF